HPYTRIVRLYLARMYGTANRPEDALRMYEAALADEPSPAGNDPRMAAVFYIGLAESARAAGYPDRALAAIRKAADALRKLGWPADRTSAEAAVVLANALGNLGRFEEAAALGREVAEATRKRSGDDSPEYAEALTALGRILMCVPEGVPE